MTDSICTRRSFLKFMGLGTAALAVTGKVPVAGAVSKAGRPNILLMIADDMT
jgi:hypothetical protein